MVSQAIKHESADTEQIEKAGWTWKQRLQKQMNQLSGSFFDEVEETFLDASANNMKRDNSQFDYFTAQLRQGSFACFVKQVDILW